MKSVFAKLNLPTIPAISAAIDTANNPVSSTANDERSQSYRNELKNLLIDKQHQIQELRRRASIDKITIERIEEDQEFKDTELNLIAPKLEILTRKSTPPIEEIMPIPSIEPKKRLPRGRRPVIRPPIVPK
jgi:DNA-binding Xre family transcriptional regulator